eukprot:g20592.t1
MQQDCWLYVIQSVHARKIWKFDRANRPALVIGKNTGRVGHHAFNSHPRCGGVAPHHPPAAATLQLLRQSGGSFAAEIHSRDLQPALCQGLVL